MMVAEKVECVLTHLIEVCKHAQGCSVHMTCSWDGASGTDKLLATGETVCPCCESMQHALKFLMYILSLLIRQHKEKYMLQQCMRQVSRDTEGNLLTYVCASDWSGFLGLQGLQHKARLSHTLSHCSCLTRVCDRFGGHLTKVAAADMHEGVMTGSGRLLDVMYSGNSNRADGSKRSQQEALDRKAPGEGPSPVSAEDVCLTSYSGN